METVRNLIGILIYFLPATAIIAIIVSLALMIKRKVKKAVLKIILAAAASLYVIWFLGPFTKGPHVKYTWKNIGKTSDLSEEEIDSAMEACKSYFCDREGFDYCWLTMMSFKENEYSYKTSHNTETITIETKIKSGFKASAAYGGWHFTCEREKGGEWQVKSIGGG